MDEDFPQKTKKLNQATESIEISDEDTAIELSPVESIIWDCCEVCNKTHSLTITEIKFGKVNIVCPTCWYIKHKIDIDNIGVPRETFTKTS